MAKGIVVVDIDAIVSGGIMCGSKIRQLEIDIRVRVSTDTNVVEEPPNLSAPKPINRRGLPLSRTKTRS
jgi:hypothetical protein